MKPCDEDRQDLALLAIDAVSGQRAHALRAHIKTCEGCRHYLEELSGVSAVIERVREAEITKPSRTFHNRVVAAVHAQENVGLVNATAWWRLAIPGACLVALAVFVISQSQPFNATTIKQATASAMDQDLRPTVANYRLAVCQSTEKLDALLAKQMKEGYSAYPVWTAGGVKDINLAE